MYVHVVRKYEYIVRYVHLITEGTIYTGVSRGRKLQRCIVSSRTLHTYRDPISSTEKKKAEKSRRAVDFFKCEYPAFVKKKY